MSKSKNKYKAPKSNLKDSSMIARSEFAFETSKWFLAAVIVAFHILPLAFLVFGETGRQALNTICMLYLNPILIFVIMLLYGVRIGFNFKMPIVCALIEAASIAMYYTSTAQEDYLFYTIQSTIVMFIVYAVISYISTAIGAFIKHYLIA